MMEKTSFKDKLGYGAASLGDSVAYGLVGVFMLFFLTTIAGIPPAIAGTIAAVGSVWNAVANPVMGYFADKVNTKYGRRRPMMFVFAIPLMVFMFLLFTDIGLPAAVKPVYYGAVMMLYWTSYTGFFVPYLALGADYTSDYDDRTILRLFGSFFNMIGTMLSMVMPSMSVEFLQSAGLAPEQAWSVTALLLGVVTSVTILITVAASKNKDLPYPETEQDAALGEAPDGKTHAGLGETICSILAEYLSVMKLKPMKYIIAADMLSLIGYTLVMSDLVYFLTYNRELGAAEISGCLFLRTVLAIIIIPVMAKLIAWTDRCTALIGCYVFGAAGMCVVKFVPMAEPAGLIIYMIFVTICTSTYWQVMPGIFYDICEYDRIKNGKSRSATIVSFQGLVEALAAGIGGQLLGLILELAGFAGDAAVQGASAKLWIENSTTILPAAVLLLSCIALYRYPINKQYYNEMIKKNQVD